MTVVDFKSSYHIGFYPGVGSASNVPGLYPLALNGRPFVLDMKHPAWKEGGRRTLPVQRAQADTSENVGEHSLNRDDLWRAKQESWHKGAGQSYLDREDSDPARFDTSKGVDPWEQWELSLLHATSSKRSSVNTNLQLLTSGSYLYISDGNELYSTPSLTGTPTWTSADIHAGQVAQSVKSTATDGRTVFAALGSSGIHSTVTGASTSTADYSALSCTLLAYVKGRLMAANGNSIYNVIASGAAPSALYTHANTDFTWVGFAAGPRHIFAAGYSGDKSLVYRIALKTDGTALEVPTAALADGLPDGDIVRSIYGYLGFILIGTDKGVHFGTVDAEGSLTLSARIETNGPVHAFEGQDRFVWFTWKNYDGTSTGLGRLDLRTINEGQAPAYASDLMATAQGTVSSVVTFGTKRVFSVQGVGVFAELDDYVASGTVDTGIITYGIPDTKIAVFADLRHAPLEGGSVALALASDEGTFIHIGTSNVLESTAPDTLAVGQVAAESFNVRLTLSRGVVTTTGPVVKRMTLRSLPAPRRSRAEILPLLLARKMEWGKSILIGEPEDDLDFLEALTSTDRLVNLQLFTEASAVTVEEVQQQRAGLSDDNKTIEGTALVTIKYVTG